MKKSLVVLLPLVIVGIALSIYSTPLPEPSINEETFSCSGSARCISGTVTSIVEGDKINVDRQGIKLALTFAPEHYDAGGSVSKQFVEKICPVGSKVLVDEDDGQTGGSFGRVLAVIYCNGVNLNSELIESGIASIETNFCPRSEFSEQDWAKNYGC